MACFSLAVIQAKVEPAVAAEILASEKALEGLRRYIESLVRTRPVTLERGTDRAEIRIGRYGEVSIRISKDGIRLTSTVFSWASVAAGTRDEFVQAIEARAGVLAIALVTDRTAAFVNRRYVVKSDQVLPNGARVQRVVL